ncbi:protein kinase [Psychrobacter sp. F1192]|uniref:Protein kinase n=1 Tax=Psychrobacter coccoides TaxID=2818440 RepID=A0ABS3NN00_9GAMM|nr:protein kinase [Psychrobacter coccoides]MBO1530796.1 protein kinase [Psychrobacter coccoides]
MRNSASNSAAIQALHRQAKQMLPALTDVLIGLGYSEIVHQRISQQNIAGAHDCYQGLTRAYQTRFGQVMIKWQLDSNPSPMADNSSLHHEIRVLRTLNQYQKNSSAIITPPWLDHKTISLSQQRLTVLIMPYYSNGSLAYALKQAQSAQQKHRFIIQAAILIDHLHQSNWLHNDIKPSNLLISDEHALMLTDFALAEYIKGAQLKSQTVGRVSSAGTPAYLAPECWHGQGKTVQTDIYAFGVLLYEVLMGERPFAITQQHREQQEAALIAAWATQHCQQPTPILPKPHQRYQQILNRALAKPVQQRYPSMQELLKALQTLHPYQ